MTTTLDRRRLPILQPDYWKGRPSPRRGRTFPPEVLTADEVGALMRHCGRPGRARARNAALIAVMWRSGLRVGEALALIPSDIEPSLGMLHVRRGKGRKPRRVGIDRGALAVVDGWLRYRDELGLEPGAPLFCTFQRDVFGPQGRPLGRAYVQEVLHRSARQAGIEKRVHPHALRHSFAFGLMSEGVNLLTISLLLGHTSTSTTDVYLRHIAPQQLLDAIADRDPWLAEVA